MPARRERHRATAAAGQGRVAEVATCLSLEHEHVIALQKSAGNQSVVRLMLQRKPPPTDPLKELALALGKRVKRDRAGVVDDLAKLTLQEREALDAVVAALPGSQAAILRRCIAFVGQRLPAEGNARSPVKVYHPGKEEDRLELGGDSIHVHTGAKYGYGGGVYKDGDSFSVTYSGARSAETRLLQFIWREIVAHYPPKRGDRKPRKVPQKGLITRGVGDYELSTNDKKPFWQVDSVDASSPFREELTAVNRSAAQMAVFDSPDARDDFASRPFNDKNNPPQKVVSSAHFALYLIQAMDIVYAANVDISWEFTSPTAFSNTVKAERSKARKLEPSQHARLRQQYAKHNLNYLA